MPLILALVFCCITGFLAMRKGYNFFLWFLSAGVIGLIILAFLPFATTPEQKRTGNIIGLCITLALLLLFAGAVFSHR